MRRALIFCTALFAASTLAAQAQGVQIKTVVHHAGPLAVPCRAAVTVPFRFAYDPFSGAGQFATAIVTLSCNSPQLLGTVAISPGHANGFARYREMWRDGTDSSQPLEYNLYTTSNDNVVWGDGSSGSSPEPVNQTVTIFNALIFAKIQYPQSSLSAGEYSDTVTVTFNL